MMNSLDNGLLRPFNPYPAYRPSGVEWLGEIPAHWEMLALKWYSRCHSGNGLSANDVSSEPLGERCTPVIGGNGLMGFTDRENCNKAVLAIGRVGALCGNVHIIDAPAWITDNALVLSVRSDFAALNYLACVLRTRNLNDVADKTAQPLITGTLVLNERMPLPPLPEQRAIAAFLDREMARIDELVARNERLIELLQEKRTALITRAVTRGLDPNTPMQDSGVEWLGEIPAHWEVKRLKYLVGKIGSGKTPRGGAERYVDDGVMFLRSQNVHFGKLQLADVAYIDADTDAEMAGSRVGEGDVLLNITGASLGRSCVARLGGIDANVNQHVCALRPDQQQDKSEFLAYSLESRSLQDQIFNNENGVSRDALNFEQIGDLVFARPALSEQQAIADFLDRETAKLDTLVAKVQEAIGRLKELRTALISAAVTGRIDVREVLGE